MDNVKHIQFERTGGFMGMRVAAEFDLDDLPDEQARQLRAMLDDLDFDELSETLSHENQVSDGYSYSVTVEAKKRSHTVNIESGAPEKLLPLLDLLSQIARQQMRKKKSN